MKKLLSILLVILMLMSFAACGEEKTVTDAGKANTEAVTLADGTYVIGQGNKEISFTVVALDGTEKKYLVKTDKETVGEALVDAGLIAGEDSAYGLYVKTVDGTTLDYDKDGKYWAFYIDGEYAMTGVDSTVIEEGKVYTFKAEKAE